MKEDLDKPRKIRSKSQDGEEEEEEEESVASPVTDVSYSYTRKVWGKMINVFCAYIFDCYYLLSFYTVVKTTVPARL